MLLAGSGLEAERCGGGWVPLGNSGTGAQARRGTGVQENRNICNNASDIPNDITASKRLVTMW